VGGVASTCLASDTRAPPHSQLRILDDDDEPDMDLLPLDRLKVLADMNVSTVALVQRTRVSTRAHSAAAPPRCGLLTRRATLQSTFSVAREAAAIAEPKAQRVCQREV
jgi:hypothetical protein